VNGLWQSLFDLLRLRAGPQDLPDSRPLTLVVIGVYVAQAVVTSGAVDENGSATRSLMAIALQFLAVAIFLAWRRRPERLQQTLLAFAATGIVISIVAFTLLLQSDPGVNQPLLALVWFVIFGWSLAVDANIFRHALDIAMPIAMLIAVLLLAFTYVVLELVLKQV